MTADWSAPRNEWPPPAHSRAGLTAWRVDYDPRDNEAGVRIYTVPTGPVPIKCVAKEVHPEDAELIVRLYSEWREGK